MGAIRRIFLVIVSVLLFLSFICVNLFGILSLSLTYNNVENQSVSVIQNSLSGLNVTDKIQEVYPLIKSVCQTNPNYVFSVTNYSIDIPCDVALQGTNAIAKEGAKNIVHQIYYTKYDCNFLDCAKSTQLPLFLLSEKAYNFWKEKFRISLIVSFVLLILLLLLVERKANMPILSGILLAISSLPFIKLDILLNTFSNKMISQFLKIFFSQSFYFSLRALIVGIVLIGLGIIFKIFNIGFFISNLISKIKKPEKGKQTVKKSVKPKQKTKPK
jgi:hypothetical protein